MMGRQNADRVTVTSQSMDFWNFSNT